MEGDTITVTWGDEFMQPKQYNGFHIGPFQATTRIGPNETFEQAFSRAYNELERMAEATFVRKRNQFAVHFANKE